MAYYTIRFRAEGKNINGVKAKVALAFGKEVAEQITKDDLATSRQSRLDSVASTVTDCAQDVDELKDELQEWFDNLPEQFQSGDKGSELEEAIQQLEEIKDGLESLDFSSVSFPGMY